MAKRHTCGIAFILFIVATIQFQIGVAQAPHFVGVCFGTNGDNLPPPDQVINLYKKYGIGMLRLYDPNLAVLNAMRGSQIDVTVGIRNEDLPTMAANPDAVHTWFATNMAPFLNQVVFSYVLVGNEVVPGPLARYVLPVMQILQEILNANDLVGTKISTSVPSSVLGNSFPPSQGVFSAETREIMIGILRFLSANRSPLSVNVYPYFAYASNPGVISLDYALFTAPGAIIRDGDLEYQNLFDAMVDAFYSAMEEAGFKDASLVVSESGWPSDGNGNFTTTELASIYNTNFVNHIGSEKGTPKRPGEYMEAFVFAMFNENLKQAGQEQHFGLFYPDMLPVYHVFDPVH